jgi:hypothetical protein
MDPMVTCEVHSVDLCKVHVRKHLDRAACRLVPTARQLAAIEKIGRGHLQEVILYVGVTADVEPIHADARSWSGQSQAA